MLLRPGPVLETERPLARAPTQGAGPPHAALAGAAAGPKSYELERTSRRPPALGLPRPAPEPLFQRRPGHLAPFTGSAPLSSQLTGPER